jgi:hypothetical protein
LLFQAGVWENGGEVSPYHLFRLKGYSLKQYLRNLYLEALEIKIFEKISRRFLRHVTLGLRSFRYQVLRRFFKGLRRYQDKLSIVVNWVNKYITCASFYDPSTVYNAFRSATAPEFDWESIRSTDLRSPSPVFENDDDIARFESELIHLTSDARAKNVALFATFFNVRDTCKYFNEILPVGYPIKITPEFRYIKALMTYLILTTSLPEKFVVQSCLFRLKKQVKECQSPKAFTAPFLNIRLGRDHFEALTALHLYNITLVRRKLVKTGTPGNTDLNKFVDILFRTMERARFLYEPRFADLE